MVRHYSIILEPEEEGGYSVSVPALPGCRTQGKTVEQCIHRAREAIADWIADAHGLGEEIPAEIAPARVLVIDVAA